MKPCLVCRNVYAVTAGSGEEVIVEAGSVVLVEHPVIEEKFGGYIVTQRFLYPMPEGALELTTVGEINKRPEA